MARERKEKNGTGESEIACSFCGKRREDVRRLVSGPGVYICDECIEQCAAIIAEAWDAERRKAPMLAACPIQIVDTSGFMNLIVS